MSGEAPSSRPTTPSRVLIATLGSNDILFGRGAGAAGHQGNERFRIVIQQRQNEYALASRASKPEIAREVYDQIHAVGGRFLKRAKTKNPTEGNFYQEVDEAAALEKIQQAFRDERKRRGSSMAVLPADMLLRPTVETLTANTDVALFQGIPWGFQQQRIDHQSTRLNPWAFQQSHYPVQEGTNLLYPRGAPLIHPDAGRYVTQLTGVSTAPTVTQPTGTQECPSFHGDSGSLGVQPRHGTHTSRNSVDTQFTETTASSQEEASADESVSDTDVSEFLFRNAVDAQSTETSASSQEDASDESVSDTDVSEFLFGSILGDPDRPKISEEQVEAELASLTEQEREAVLSDMFGRMRSVHSSKRARRDLDPEVVRLLVR